MEGFCLEETGVSSATAELPPGFRFHPTDEEIIIHYLTRKAVDRRFTASAIGDVDINKCEPWDLRRKAKTGESEWFFFCQKDRKYPTGMRTNRATESGYWKATGKDKEIFKEMKKGLIGMKKTLVFYKGRAPKGEKTNWVLHEYRLEGNLPAKIPKSAKDEWVVCKVFDKGKGIKKAFTGDEEVADMDSLMNYNLDSFQMPSLIDNSCSFDTPFIDFQSNHESKFIGHVNNPRQKPYKPDQKDVQIANSSIQNVVQNPYFCSQNSEYLHHLPSYPEQNIRFNYPSNLSYKSSMAGKIGMQDPCQMTKIEQFSSNNSVLCHSQDTGISSEFTNEITSMYSRGDTVINKTYIEGLEDLAFSPDLSGFGFQSL